MTQDQCIRDRNNSASDTNPIRCKKTRIASFSRSNITVTMKMVSKFNADTGEYEEPSPRISFMINGKYNRIVADPELLKDLGAFLVTLGDTMQSLGIREEASTETTIRDRIERFVSDSKTISEMTS